MKIASAASKQTIQTPPDVFRFQACSPHPIHQLLARYGMVLRVQLNSGPITGSYWGDEEAGLEGNVLVVRGDTPLHSVLHETCHYVCMSPTRRNVLHTNAGGDYDEENAVCYLQILLADEIPGLGRQRMFADMDAWGYTFRLGDAHSWFTRDAEDARDLLLSWRLIDADHKPTYLLRMDG